MTAILRSVFAGMIDKTNDGQEKGNEGPVGGRETWPPGVPVCNAFIGSRIVDSVSVRDVARLFPLLSFAPS